MSFRGQRRLAVKFNNYPLIRALILDGRFRIVFVLVVIGVAVTGLMLPKIYRTTPKDFTPTIKVSGLDLIQARSLRKSAEKAHAEKRYDDAFYSWQSALANNQGDPDLIRGTFRTVLAQEQPSKLVSHLVLQSDWLLRLARTNAADLELAAETLHKHRALAAIDGVLEARKDQLSPRLEELYARSLFDQGRSEDFITFYKERAARLAQNKAVGIYHAAYLAGWGNQQEAGKARETLSNALNDAELRNLANRLYLVVSARAGDVAGYERMLTQLQNSGEAALVHHVQHWNMLARSGQKDRALQLLRDNPIPPVSPHEALALLDVAGRVTTVTEQHEMLEKVVRSFPYSDRIAILYAQRLAQLKKWDELRRFSAELRTNPSLSGTMGGFANYLDGLIALGNGVRTEAAQMFERIVGIAQSNPALHMRIALDLTRIGFHETAGNILKQIESAFADRVDFWALTIAAAAQARDLDVMLTASERAYRLKPEHPQMVNLYVASSLLARTNLDESLKLTRELYEKHTNSVAARINYGAALMLNRQAAAAEPLLIGANTNALNRAEMALYQFDLIELYSALNKPAEARQIAEAIETELLFPAQQEALKQLRAGSNARGG